jgi:hypothetical protein
VLWPSLKFLVQIKARLPRGRSLAAGEIGGLFAACEADPTPAGTRDAAILALLYAAGLRRSEAVALDCADWDVEAGELYVLGKGRRERLAYLQGGAAKALKSWLEVRGKASGSLLCPIGRGGRIEVRRLSAQAVLLVCRKRAEEAGVKRFSPHDLRRTFIGDLLDAGVDLSTVQQMAGHAQVTTTVRYDRKTRGPQAAGRSTSARALRTKAPAWSTQSAIATIRSTASSRSLQAHEINSVVDVRTRPASRWCPHFNRKPLAASLAEECIAYYWRGRHLGGLGNTRISEKGFVADMSDVLAMEMSQNVILLCSERHPRDCHRATKLTAWIHQNAPGTWAHHLLPPSDGLCKVIASPVLEESLDVERLWWELHPDGQYGRPEK